MASAPAPRRPKNAGIWSRLLREGLDAGPDGTDRSIVLLLFLQKQNLANAIYLFGLGTLSAEVATEEVAADAIKDAIVMRDPAVQDAADAINQATDQAIDVVVRGWLHDIIIEVVHDAELAALEQFGNSMIDSR